MTSTLTSTAPSPPPSQPPSSASASSASSSLPMVAPDREFGATRSSHNWQEMPGNWDRLNIRALYPSSNQWGIPDLPVARLEPSRLVAYTDRRGAERAATERSTGHGTDQAAVHFFLDDYRFEVIWSKPERGLSRTCSVGAALTPDFSLWRTMPRAMQLWQVYRSRWCGAWLLQHGVDVVPTVSWSTPDTYDFCFAGIPTGSVVAVSTVGIWRDPVARELFADGFAAMCDRLKPALVLVYGKAPAEHGDAGLRLRCYPSRWDGA